MPTKLDIPKMFFCSGLVISWIYLRFYQMHANGSRGDTADGFAFASFFPNVIQPPIAVFGNTVFSILGKKIYSKRKNHSHMTVSCILLLPPIWMNSIYVCHWAVRLKVCKRPIRRYAVSGGGLAGGSSHHGGSGTGSISISLPGVENHDTERRRQIALKALSDRLSKAESQSSSSNQQSWPSLGNFYLYKVTYFYLEAEKCQRSFIYFLHVEI